MRIEAETRVSHLIKNSVLLTGIKYNARDAQNKRFITQLRHTHTHTHIHTHRHTQAHTHTYTHRHTHMYIYIYIYKTDPPKPASVHCTDL